MAIVYIPPQIQKLTGAAQVEVSGSNVREIIEQLEQRFPGIAARLCDNGQLSPALQLSVDQVMTRMLSTKVESATEVHFLPVIGGG
ncbi:MAG: MoaD/ThiS family protein [Fuerstiella sp.]|nr:MoaD/ThiS family protein [Fuerstiella sp.]